MAWMIGIDEAGYGPNLGPLVVAATVWRVERRSAQRTEVAANSVSLSSATHDKVDLYQRLAAFVSSAPRQDRLAIADSKALYKPRGGLQLLERGVLTALAIADNTVPQCWSDLVTDCRDLPWYANFDCDLPIDAQAEEIATAAEALNKVCRQTGVQLEGVYRRMVFPREFNSLCEQHGTKGAALSHVTIGLLRSTIDRLSLAPDPSSLPQVSVACDKHGGRNRYASLLQHHFPEHWIDTYEESRGVSSYGWGPPEERVSVTFRARGEAELPTALASMTAKYHRELAMRAFNAFWCSNVEGLAPTAGYPQDAKRFKQAIASHQKLLGIDDADLWRNR